MRGLRERQPGIGRMDIFDLECLYDIAKKQDEGLGTAYEYRVKLKLLHRLLTKADCRPESILIAGLPEKYGYSMDLVLLAQALEAKLTVLDERECRLEKFEDLCRGLRAASSDHLTLIKTSSWDNFSSGKNHDLIVSCEVLQRLDEGQKISYFNELGHCGKMFVAFAPSAENKSHAKLSGLNTVSLGELEGLLINSGLELLSSGYLDAPPFPPGLKLSRRNTDQSGQHQSNHILEKIAMLILGGWSRIERAIPNTVMQRVSHIAYVSGVRELRQPNQGE